MNMDRVMHLLNRNSDEGNEGREEKERKGLKQLFLCLFLYLVPHVPCHLLCVFNFRFTSYDVPLSSQSNSSLASHRILD